MPTPYPFKRAQKEVGTPAFTRQGPGDQWHLASAQTTAPEFERPVQQVTLYRRAR